MFVKQILCVSLIFCCLFGLIGCVGRSDATKTELMMDTVVSVTVEDTADADETVEECLALCRTLANVMDRHNPQSEIRLLNDSHGEWRTLSPELYTVLQKAVFYADLSDKALDVTVTPLIDLWDFSASNPAVPSLLNIKNSLKKVNADNIELNEGHARLLNGATVDLGALVKGYIADRVVALLNEKGVKKATVNLGGNVYLLCETLTAVGIQKPFDSTGKLAAKVMLKNQTAVTSGRYQRCFTQEGIVYHHILDTKTGYPVQNELDSVTVIGQSSVDCDGLSTLLFVLGVEQGKQFLKDHHCDEQAIFLLRDGTVEISDGLAMNDNGCYYVK